MADNFIGKDASGSNVTFDALDTGGGVLRPRKEDPNVGLKADTAATTDTGTFTLISLFKRLLQKITAQLPAALGQTTASASLPVTLPSDQGALATTIADGSSVSLGAKADTAASADSGTFSLIAINKRLVARLTSLIGQHPAALGQTTMSASMAVTLASDQTALATSVADGSSVSLGAKADTAASADTGTFSLIAIQKRLVAKLTSLIALFPTALGQTTMSASLPVTLASNQSNLPVICASTTQTLTIANAATTSDAVTGAASYQSFGVIMPAAFTGTTLTFTVCDTSGGTYVALYDRFGNQVTITVTTSRAYDLPVELIGWPFWKIVSGSAEGGSRSLVVVEKS